MSWVSPKTWSTGELVTAAMMNAEVRDRLLDLWLYQAKGDLLIPSGPNNLTRLPVGQNGYSLLADSLQTSGVKWGKVSHSLLDGVATTGGAIPLHVTGGDAHDHVGGDGGQINHVNLANIHTSGAYAVHVTKGDEHQHRGTVDDPSWKVSHANLLNSGTKTHAEIDTYMATRPLSIVYAHGTSAALNGNYVSPGVTEVNVNGFSGIPGADVVAVLAAATCRWAGTPTAGDYFRMTRAGDGSSNALLLRHWFDGMDTDASALVPTYNNQVRLEVAGAIGVTIWIVIYGYILKA